MCMVEKQIPYNNGSSTGKTSFSRHANTMDVITEQKSKKEQKEKELKRGILIGTSSLALLFIANTVTIPYMQSRRDQLGCDSMCVGSMTSIRSILSLIGATLIGKLSDSTLLNNLYSGGARRVILLVGIIASGSELFMNYYNTSSLHMLYISMIPGALFSHNMDIMKALFSDYHEYIDTLNTNGDHKILSSAAAKSSSDRAASIGMLGMAMGLALMVGPLAGVSVFSSYEQATKFGFLCNIIAGLLVMILPQVQLPQSAQNKASKAPTMTNGKSFFQFLDIPVVRSQGAIFFITTRCLMALAFHIFQTIWTSSLHDRFDFGPKDYGRFFSFIGLTYALSQGIVAKFLLDYCGFGKTIVGRVRLLLTCCIFLAFGRYFAFQTKSLLVVYSLFAFVVTSLGIVNTIFSVDTSKIAPPNEIGTLFGVLSSCQSAAGMAGPVVGGLLSSYIHPIYAPLFAVIACYAIVFIMIFTNYESILTAQQHKLDKDKKLSSFDDMTTATTTTISSDSDIDSDTESLSAVDAVAAKRETLSFQKKED